MKTKDYQFFKFRKENRELSEQNVLKLVNSIKDFGFIEGRDVLVDEEGFVIDGQHRVEACKRLGIEIPYQVANGDFMKKTIALNACQKPWTLEDYVNSYSKQGVDFYRKLVKFNEKYNLGIGVCIDVFIQSAKFISQGIREGKEFKINEDADNVAQFILDCSCVPYFKNKQFARSIVYLFKKANEKQREYIKLNILSVPQQPNLQSYLTVYENLLNHKKRAINKIKL